MTSFKAATRWMGVGVAGLMMAGAVQAGSHDHDHPDIVDTAVAAGQFETLVAAVEAAGLVDTLKGRAPSPSSLLPTRPLPPCRKVPWTSC
ncbi:hypothetical protein [Halomonas sp. Y3]|uniref:hypothetical protein n=1 Tax=Halomonas sp. Y3 TaxID=2956797 RepID=UPI0020A117C4|nr:hypothetical protein [Halomonas sp. Y3]